MEEKSYAQMRKEFRDFYYYEVKDKLSEYESMRKQNVPKLIGVYGMLISVLCTFIFVILGIAPIAAVFFLLCFVFTGFMHFINKRTPKEFLADTEKILKNALMKKFLNIFFTSSKWKVNISNKDLPKIQEYLALNILNSAPVINFDDVINALFRNVRIDIYEADTNIFNLGGLFILLFAGLFVGGCLLMFLAGSGIFLFSLLPPKFAFGIFLAVFVFFILPLIVVNIIRYQPFKGLIIEIQMNKNFEGHTFFLEKSISAKKIPVNSSVFKEVKLEMSEFSKNYTAYSDNQVEARYLLTTAFMERICNLNLAFNAKFVRGAFKNNKLTLAIDCGKDMFAMGSNFKKSDEKTFMQLYDEMVSVLQIIDELKLNERTGL